MTGASCCRHTSNDRLVNFELKIVLWSVLKIQRWWRSFLELKRRIRSVIIIQSHFRGWTARKIATRERHRIRVIQVSLNPHHCALQRLFTWDVIEYCIYATTLLFCSEIMSSMIVIFSEKKCHSPGVCAWKISLPILMVCMLFLFHYSTVLSSQFVSWLILRCWSTLWSELSASVPSLSWFAFLIVDITGILERLHSKKKL